MEKKYRVVEIKENDLYVLYDVDGGGVCCCSKYTIKQLMQDYGAIVEGVTVTEKGVKVQELSLDGKVRNKKAPVVCEDETKRSAVTIIKGLDEKHYPRVKQDRGGSGKETMAIEKGESIEFLIADGTTMKLRVGDIKKFISTDGTVVGIVENITALPCWEKGEPKKYEINVITTTGDKRQIGSKFLSGIVACRLEEEIRELLTEMLGYEQMMVKLYKKEKAIYSEMDEEVRKVKHKYEERVDVERKKRAELSAKYSNTGHKLLHMQDKVAVAQVIAGDLRKRLGEKIKYRVLKDESYAGVAGKTGEFEIKATYHGKEGIWSIYLTASVRQRLSYSDLEKMPWFYKEYDGNMFAVGRDELMKSPSTKKEWLRKEEYYKSTISEGLKGGEVTVDLGVDDASAGCFSYYYRREYKIKGAEYPTRAEYNAMLEQIK